MPFLPCKYPLFRCSNLHSCDAVRDICKINSFVLWYPCCGSFLVSLSRTSEGSVCFDYLKSQVPFKLKALLLTTYISHKVLKNLDLYDSCLYNRCSFAGIYCVSFH